MLSNNYIIIGKSSLEDGNLLKTKKFFKKAYELDPTNIELLYDFAVLCAEYNHNEEAIEYYNYILDLDLNQAGAYYGKAIIYDEIEEDEKAIFNYKLAIKYDEEYFHAYLYLADIYERNNNNILAEEYYKKSLYVEKKNIWAYINYGSFLEHNNRNQEALEMFEEVLSIIPNHYLALFNKGVVNTKLGFIDIAIDNYLMSIEENKTYPYSFLNLSIIKKNQSLFEEAEAIISHGIKYNNETSVLYYNRAIFLTRLKRFEEAIENLEESIILSPSLKKYALKDEEFKELFEYRKLF